MIIQDLRDIQHEYGYLPDAELRALSRRIEMPLARIEEVTTFFPAFRLERRRPAAVEVRVCRDMTCHLRGAPALIAAGQKVAAELNADGGDVEVTGVSCLGRCDRAPAVWAERQPMPDKEHAWVYAAPDAKRLERIVRTLAAGQRPEPDPDEAYKPAGNFLTGALDVYARNGWPRDYRAVRGFAETLVEKRRRCVPRPPLVDGQPLQGPALDAYVREAHPWLWKLNESRLGGMGGAGAPAYQKWLDVWGQRSPFDEDAGARPALADTKPTLFDKYVVANGDESEPGTFKDREIMQRTPHLIVEGVILAGLFAGCSSGYIFVRHEYHEQVKVLREEVVRAEAMGACGPNVFGSGRAFPVEVIESPGGYICGEQTALIEAMEGRRAQPRNRPPDITSNGFRDRPTILNNVETLAWTPLIVLTGGAAYSGGGWRVPATPKLVEKPPRFGGRRLLSVSGDVKRPGVYEVPIGLPLGELFGGPDYCGGVLGTLKAVATSGPSGGILPAKFPLPPDFHAKFAEQLGRKKDRARKDGDAKRAEAVKAGKEYREPAEEAYSLEEWFVATHLPAGATHFDLATAPIDLKFFGLMADLVGLPVSPLLGAGIVVYAEGADILDQAVCFTRFFRNESCGKCVPCRLGAEKLVRIGESLLAARRAGGNAEVAAVRSDINDVAWALTQTSICSLGTSAATPLACALTYFPDEVANGRAE